MKKKIIDKVWSEGAISFMNVKHTSQMRVLHPEMANLINKQKPKRILDFGCGDGRMLKLLDNGPQIDLYDKFFEMTELAMANVGERINNYFRNIDDIPKNEYDAVVLGMVLVCIDNEPEYLDVLKKIAASKTNEGKVYISVTHPCFRDRQFSNFRTSFGDSQEYTYFKEGQVFDVFIEDDEPPSVAFRDYHWSLSFTINKIVEAGMKIHSIKELKDDMSHSNSNKYFSTFIIITAE